jgi:3-oxoacyl-[acyl-carrier-protein] synthase-3
MYHSKIAGLGFYVPSNVVTNDDLTKSLIQLTNGFKEGIGRRHYQRRRYNHIYGVKAAEIAIERSGVAKEDIDFVVFCY